MTIINPASPSVRTRNTVSNDRYVHLYTELAKRVKSSGLLHRRYGYYWTMMSLITVSLILVAGAIFLLRNSWFQVLLAIPLSLVLGQLAGGGDGQVPA